MRTRLANGLVLGFLFAVNPTWARQSSPAESRDQGQQIALGVYDYAPPVFEQKQLTLEGTLEHDPAFTEAARKTWEQVDYGELRQEAGFMVSRTVGSTSFKIPSGGVFSTLNTHPRPSMTKNWVQQPSLLDIDLARNFKLNRYVVTASGLWLVEPNGNPLVAQSDSVAVLAGMQPVFSTTIELPIQLCRDYLVVVQGSIGTLEKLTFIIDTGTYPSIVDQRIATALGLSEREGKVALVDHSVQAKLATLPFVGVGPTRVESVPVLVQDLSSLEKTLGRRIDAIVGLDVLGKNSFTINYRTKRLRFGAVEPSRFTVSFETGQPLITVEARLHDRPVRLLVDTGAAALLLFQSRVKDPISPLAGKPTRATNLGGGDFQLQSVLIQDMRMGKEELGPQTGFVMAGQRDEGQNFDGLLSMRGLHLEEIGFDFENRRISWKK